MRKLDIYDCIIGAGIFIYSTFFSYLSIFRYHTFQLEYDLAIFNQSLWTTIAYGELLYNSLEQGSHFAVHFSPILFTLLPVYFFFPYPETLLISQSCLLALGSIPIYLCGRNLLGNKEGSIVGLLYLLYPSIHGVNLYDFHELAFLPFILGMALWSYHTNNNRFLILFGFLALLVKEDVSLIIFMIGFVGYCKKWNRSESNKSAYIALILMSAFVLITYLGVIRPMLAAFIPSLIPGFLPNYFDPMQNLTCHNENRIIFFFMTFVPLIFTPFIAPDILIISLPSFLEIFLSPSPRYFNISYQYSALLVPILFMSMVHGLLRIKNSTLINGRRFVSVLLFLIAICTTISTIIYSPAAYQVKATQVLDDTVMNEHRAFLYYIIDKIPENVSVSTQYNLLPVLSNRRHLGVDFHQNADIILIDSKFFWRSHIFNDDKDIINNSFNLLFSREDIQIYVNNKKEKLQRELKNSLNNISI